MIAAESLTTPAAAQVVASVLEPRVRPPQAFERDRVPDDEGDAEDLLRLTIRRALDERHERLGEALERLGERWVAPLDHGRGEHHRGSRDHVRGTASQL
jgi:hypothetical protein